MLEHNRHGGATTPNMPDADGLYLAIRVKDAVYGVVGIAVGEHHMDVYENSILLSILGECALALENQKMPGRRKRRRFWQRMNSCGQIFCGRYLTIFGHR